MFSVLTSSRGRRSGGDATVAFFDSPEPRLSRATGLLIWECGTASIVAYLWFGDWAHMEGQTSSVEVFWTTSALQHGMLAVVLLGMTYLAATIVVGAKRGLSTSQIQCRTAYLICMIGFFVAGWTVDFWGQDYAALFFMIGSGLWLLSVPDKADAPRRSAEPSPPTTPQAIVKPKRGAPAPRW